MACIWESWELGHQATSRKSDFHTVGTSPLAHSIQHPGKWCWENTWICCQQHEKTHRHSSCETKCLSSHPYRCFCLYRNAFLCEVLCQRQASSPSWSDWFSPTVLSLPQHRVEKRGQHWTKPLLRQWEAAAGSGREQQPRKPQAIRLRAEQSPAVVADSGEKQ